MAAKMSFGEALAEIGGRAADFVGVARGDAFVSAGGGVEGLGGGGGGGGGAIARRRRANIARWESEEVGVLRVSQGEDGVRRQSVPPLPAARQDLHRAGTRGQAAAQLAKEHNGGECPACYDG